MTAVPLGRSEFFNASMYAFFFSFEVRKWKTARLAAAVCFIGFLGGLIYTTGAGLYLLDIVDHFVTNFNLVIIGMLQAILVGWIYGANKLRNYINEVSDIKVGKWWNFAIRIFIPLALLFLLVNQLITEIKVPYESYPMWALSIGWLVVIVPLFIFLWMFIKKSN